MRAGGKRNGVPDNIIMVFDVLAVINEEEKLIGPVD